MIRKPESLIMEYLSDHQQELVEKYNIPHSNERIPFIINGELEYVVEYDSNPYIPILIELRNVVTPIYLSTEEGVGNGKREQ